MRSSLQVGDFVLTSCLLALSVSQVQPAARNPCDNSSILLVSSHWRRFLTGSALDRRLLADKCKADETELFSVRRRAIDGTLVIRTHDGKYLVPNARRQLTIQNETRDFYRMHFLCAENSTSSSGACTRSDVYVCVESRNRRRQRRRRAFDAYLIAVDGTRKSFSLNRTSCACSSSSSSSCRETTTNDVDPYELRVLDARTWPALLSDRLKRSCQLEREPPITIACGNRCANDNG
ncbi:uncharacterized protein [Oscarella lobularis]|uniref:uncharacterized protein n=1 Tax=Oscarella lobularis TaxID=121494 RepID=UPI003313C089